MVFTIFLIFLFLSYPLFISLNFADILCAAEMATAPDVSYDDPLKSKVVFLTPFRAPHCDLYYSFFLMIILQMHLTLSVDANLRVYI